MSSKVDFFLNKTLGPDFFESLEKFELWKPGTKTVVDHEEVKTALQIVPRVIMALLIKELTSMEIEETKEFALPVESGAVLKATKHERDVFTGDIREGSKVIVDFKYRTIPGIGLVVMSAFELYDTSRLMEDEEGKHDEDLSSKVQKIIDERLALYDLIDKVVEKKIEQKDAVAKIVLKKLTPVAAPVLDINPLPKEESKPKKVSKFREFMERKNKPKEFSIHMMKSESISCPDCGKTIISNGAFSGCICLGENMDSKIYIKKSEDGIKVRFGRGWDQENIQMLLEVLRRKHD